jgi:hypothetical protein
LPTIVDPSFYKKTKKSVVQCVKSSRSGNKTDTLTTFQRTMNGDESDEEGGLETGSLSGFGTATTAGAANRPGPSGWACKGAHAALQMLAGY